MRCQKKLKKTVNIRYDNYLSCFSKPFDYVYTIRPVSSVVKHIHIDAGGLGFDSRAGQIGHSDVSSELCCPGAEPRRWSPALVTRFGVLPRV